MDLEKQIQKEERSECKSQKSDKKPDGNGKVNIKDCYASIQNGEVFIHSMHIIHFGNS